MFTILLLMDQASLFLKFYELLRGQHLDNIFIDNHFFSSFSYREGREGGGACGACAHVHALVNPVLLGSTSE